MISPNVHVLLQATRQLPSPPSPPGADGSTDSFPGADKVKEAKEAGQGAAENFRSSVPKRGRR